MDNLLEIDGAIKAFPKPEATKIPEFETLIEEADIPERELAYIYHMENVNSNYMAYSTEQKPREIKKDLFGDKKWEEPEYVENARKKYRQLIRTPEQDLLESAIDTVYKYIDYFDSIDPTAEDDKGKLKYNMKDVTRIMEKLPGVVDTLEDLRERVNKKKDGEGDIRGGVELTEFNKG